MKLLHEKVSGENISIFSDSTPAGCRSRVQVPHASQALVELGRKVQWDVDKAAVFAQVHPREANSELKIDLAHGLFATHIYHIFDRK